MFMPFDLSNYAKGVRGRALPFVRDRIVRVRLRSQPMSIIAALDCGDTGSRKELPKSKRRKATKRKATKKR